MNPASTTETYAAIRWTSTTGVGRASRSTCGAGKRLDAASARDRGGVHPGPPPLAGELSR